MGDSAPPPSSDRRGGVRFLACYPAALERPDGVERPALIRDLSESGILLFVRTTKLAVGDRVKLSLFLSENTDQVRAATGRVVRVEHIVPLTVGPWLLRAAVQFDEPFTVQSAEVAAFHERAQRLGIPKG
jgi:hypothetical protein